MDFRASLGMSAAVKLAAVAVLCSVAAAPAKADLSGSIVGWVKDERGAPQMGAAVSILTAEGQLAKRVFTDYSGQFIAEGLLPGAYAVKVALGRFLPLTRDNVQVTMGGRTVLDVSMRGLFSSLTLVYPSAGVIKDMTDDWKWVLRTAHSTRPALRIAPSPEHEETERVLRKLQGTFVDTQAYAELSGGAGVAPGALANKSDLGTSFALATSVFGDNNVTVSGNLGNSATGENPATAFRTSYRRDLGMVNPEVSLTVRQLQASAVAGRTLFGSGQTGENAPTLETFSLGFGDRVKIGESTDFEYGFLYESVRFMQRLDFISPYGKVVYRPREGRRVELRYASGAPRPDATVTGNERLRQQVSMLGMFPRVALHDGNATVQRTEHIELAVHEQVGKNLIEAGVFQDTINDAAVSAYVPDAMLTRGQVLPDLFSRASTLNGGRHFTRGYRVSYARKLADQLEAALGYSNSGVLTSSTDTLESNEIGDLRNSSICSARTS
ncbi:MAG: carboxypeptidase-like regulatory domain-containing protein [Bryobacterales bacterium]